MCFLFIYLIEVFDRLLIILFFNFSLALILQNLSAKDTSFGTNINNSIIVQLANATPQLDKFLTQEDNKVYSRTETIEIYRANMNSNTYKSNYK